MFYRFRFSPIAKPQQSMVYRYFVIIILFCSNGQVSNNEFKEISFRTTVSSAASQVVNDFYTHVSSTLLITRSVFHPQNRLTQMGVINEILYRTSSKIVVVIEEYLFLSTTIHRFYNLMFIDSYEAFL